MKELKELTGVSFPDLSTRNKYKPVTARAIRFLRGTPRLYPSLYRCVDQLLVISLLLPRRGGQQR